MAANEKAPPGVATGEAGTEFLDRNKFHNTGQDARVQAATASSRGIQVGRSAPLPRERLRHLARQTHRLGERPLYELFAELDAGADLAERLEIYARLPVGLIDAAEPRRMSSYAETALDRECADLARATAGRNDRLNRAAFNIGQLVGAGEIGRGEAERTLFDAAHACGYVQQDGVAAARATIKSGLDRGERKPRQVERVTRTPPRTSVPWQVEPPRTDDAETERERAKARWLWRQRQPIAGTVAEVYLREARGHAGAIPPTLAYLPPRNGYEPALIAAFGMATEPKPGELTIDDDTVKAVQLIKLRPDGGGKADVEPNKLIIGRGALGSPIVLAPPNDLLGLAICEGLEDGLSIHRATGLGAWASGGAGRLPALAYAVPDYIECANVFGDNDDAGRRYATDLTARLRARGFEVILKFLCAGSST